MKAVVTGAAGMIGSNLVHGLNAVGIDEVIAVDDLSDGSKYRNLAGARLSDYFDKDDFYGRFARREFGRVDVVLHQGACSDTMEQNGRLMLDSNYRCSRNLLDACQAQGTRLLYASTAAIYGGSVTFREQAEFERPLNVYGYSKLLFDQVVRSRLGSTASQVAGFRYFNVYGPREQHKGRMASVAFHNYGQFRESRQRAPVRRVRWLSARASSSATSCTSMTWWRSTCGSSSIPIAVECSISAPAGRRAFNEVAHATVNACRALRGEGALALEQLVAKKLIQYVEFPAALVGKYQCHTQADLAALRAAGCELQFADVATGVKRYVDWLAATPP